MKIAVATIAKNEAQFVQRWADSSKEADYRLILDTGSSDAAYVIATNNGIHWKQKIFDPWRFDHARNHALSLIPDDIDYVIWLDMDEVLQPGWREALESMSVQGNIHGPVIRPRYKYVWSWNEDGSESLVYGGDKIHARHGYRWKHPVHEVIKPDVWETHEWIQGLEIHHHPDHTKSRGQYFDLLKLAVEEDPRDDRNQFYLAREYFFHGHSEMAQFHFSEFLKLSKWAPERAAAYRYLAKLRPNVAEHFLWCAVAEDSKRRENWVALATLFYNQSDWESVRTCCQMALAIKEKPLDYLCESDAWGWLPHDLLAIASHHLGDKVEAWRHGTLASELNPRDTRLQDNLVHYRL